MENVEASSLRSERRQNRSEGWLGPSGAEEAPHTRLQRDPGQSRCTPHSLPTGNASAFPPPPPASPGFDADASLNFPNCQCNGQTSISEEFISINILFLVLTETL